MVHIANTSQQITHQVLFPTGIHSRWINLQLMVAAGVGNSDIEFTSPLPDTFRLLEMKLTVFPQTAGALVGLFIHLNTGTTKTPTEEDVAVRWDKIIDHGLEPTPRFIFRGTQITLRWEMNKLYTGQSRRLGCVVENFGSLVGADVWVGFRISEG